MSDQGVPESNAEWRDLLLGVHPDLLRMRRLLRHVPSDPRCKLCLSPHGGVGGPVLRLFGFGRYPRNPQLCNNCLGDAVNAASRIGSEAGAGELLVSAATASATGLATGALEPRRLELRGRSEPIDAWAERIAAAEVAPQSS